jgi:ubiquinone/menaquinone biosynthesis C-methylase UbiE
MTDTRQPTSDLSYEAFSRSPSYGEANRVLASALDITDVHVLADLACGTGALTSLLIDRLEELGVPVDRGSLHVVGADISEDALERARRHLQERRPECSIEFRCSAAERLALPDHSVNVVAMGNAIHLVEDKPGLFAEVHRMLRPGGHFLFNTSFYAGTFVSGTERLYLDWVRYALAEAVSTSGPRGRGGRPAFTSPWLTPEQYAAMLEAGGLVVRRATEHEVGLTREDLENIGRYSGLSSVLLPGYPVAVASRCLAAAAGTLFGEAALSEIRRRWLTVDSVRPAT